MSTQTTTTVIERSQTETISPTQAVSKKYTPTEINTLNETIRLRQTIVSGGFSKPPLMLPAILLVIYYHRQIPFWDCFFSVAFPFYIYLANRFRFDNNAPLVALRKQRGDEFPGHPDFFTVNKESWFPKYMVFAASLGVLLPLLIQVAAPLRVAQATAPHLFLLLNQIMMEHVGMGPEFHPMLWMMVPLGYSSYRMSSLKTWVFMAWNIFLTESPPGLFTWETFHLLLAASNAVFWTYNLFVTLTLRILPQCMHQENFPSADVSWKYMLPSVNKSATLKNKND